MITPVHAAHAWQPKSFAVQLLMQLMNPSEFVHTPAQNTTHLALSRVYSSTEVIHGLIYASTY